MKNSIPTYQLQKIGLIDDLKQNIFFTESTVKNDQMPRNIPFRSDYFGISICLDGTAVLTADLENFPIARNSIIAMPPQTIKQWTEKTVDFRILLIFFKTDLFLKIFKDIQFLNRFQFFQGGARHVISVAENIAGDLQTQFLSVKNILESDHPYAAEIAINQIVILLYHYQSLFVTESAAKKALLTRSQQIASEFKIFVTRYFKEEHGLKFYADQLAVSAKHLSEMIKSETGKTAGEWIDETLILEAKALLANPNTIINQIAYELNFPNQSAFGKFFKNLTGISPKEYKKNL